MTESELQKYWIEEIKGGDGYESKLVYGLLQDAARASKGGVLLDAGAGHQRYAPFFKDSIYISQEHPDGIQFKNMQAIHYDLIAPIDKCIPLLDGVVDAVLSTSVIEHIRYPERFFAEAFRVLKPGGKIFICAPFVYPEHEKPYDFQRPTQFGLRRWLEDACFTDVEIKPISSSTYTVMCFLMEAINEDYRRGGLIHSTLKRLVKLLSWMTAKYVDKGPTAETTFPCGWVAEAEKPLQPFNPAEYKDKDDFLKRYAVQPEE